MLDEIYPILGSFYAFFDSLFHHFLARFMSYLFLETRTVRISTSLHSYYIDRTHCRYRIPAIVSSVIVTIAAFAIFIWALAKQGNAGPLINHSESIYGVEKLEGSQLGWAMTRMITSGIGGWAGGVGHMSNLWFPLVADFYGFLYRFSTRVVWSPALKFISLKKTDTVPIT